jgi:hypothetical protein
MGKKRTRNDADRAADAAFAFAAPKAVLHSEVLNTKSAFYDSLPKGNTSSAVSYLEKSLRIGIAEGLVRMLYRRQATMLAVLKQGEARILKTEEVSPNWSALYGFSRFPACRRK